MYTKPISEHTFKTVLKSGAKRVKDHPFQSVKFNQCIPMMKSEVEGFSKTKESFNGVFARSIYPVLLGSSPGERSVFHLVTAGNSFSLLADPNEKPNSDSVLKKIVGTLF
jgi:hypothetical protein